MTSTTTAFATPQQRTIWRTEIIETVTLAWPIALT
jgi:hypothetical protein